MFSPPRPAKFRYPRPGFPAVAGGGFPALAGSGFPAMAGGGFPAQSGSGFPAVAGGGFPAGTGGELFPAGPGGGNMVSPYFREPSRFPQQIAIDQCRRCGQRGHYYAQCPNAAPPADSRPAGSRF